MNVRMEKHTGGEVGDISCIIYLISFESVYPIIRSKNLTLLPGIFIFEPEYSMQLGYL